MLSVILAPNQAMYNYYLWKKHLQPEGKTQNKCSDTLLDKKD